MKFQTNKVGTYFEQLGYRTLLDCRDEPDAIQICGLQIHSFEEELRPELATLRSEIETAKHRHGSLHDHLYDRPDPVNDATMLGRNRTMRILSGLAVVAALASVVGNTVTFVLLGFAMFLAVLAAIGMTVLPVIVGHLAYEWIMASSRWLQVAVAVAAVILCFAGLVRLGQARNEMINKAVSVPSVNSYVEGAEADTPSALEPKPEEDSDVKIHRTMGEGLLLVMIAVELALGFLVGRVVWLASDEDIIAWKELKKLGELLVALEERISELSISVEVAKKRCMAGILRAKNTLNKRRSPYHKRAAMLILSALFAARAWSQNAEAILIDTSGSISRGGTANELFHEYLTATHSLLLTEPPNTRVWISDITTDSFGGTREILKGWTPESRGVFTDDLNRARRQLASTFEAKSSGIAPVASGTDIFGALWHVKAVLESNGKVNSSSASKTIRIFSDMVNETKAFPMPDLLADGPQLMLKHAKANGLVVPLQGYRVHIYGASTTGLTPQAWMKIKEFWARYFLAAGAELVSYSSNCDVQR